MVASALEKNGSIVDGGGYSGYEACFKRNKENHERAKECVVSLLAIKTWRDGLNGVQKEDDCDDAVEHEM